MNGSNQALSWLCLTFWRFLGVPDMFGDRSRLGEGSCRTDRESMMALMYLRMPSNTKPWSNER